MNKRIASLLLCLTMVFTILVTAVPVTAAETVKFIVTADKTEASPGDIITYTITLGAVTKFGGVEMHLVIPTGLTLISGEIPSDLETTMGTDELNWTLASATYWAVVVDMAGYTSATPTKLLTFKCKVDDGASGSLTVGCGIKEVYDNEINDVPYEETKPTVTIVSAPKPATAIELNKTSLTLTVGSSEALTATVTPADSTDTVAWTSNSASIASVDNTGKVSAIAPGTTTITAKAGDKTATCTVTVVNAPCTHGSKTTVAAKDSTCKDKGWDAYQRCNNCDKIFDMSGNVITEIPYLSLGAHNCTSEIKKTETLKTAGTCRDKAVYYYSCSVCGDVEHNDSHTFEGDKNAANHVGGTYLKDKKDATCKEAGYTGDTYCSGCDAKLSDGTATAKSAHTPASNWSYDDSKHWKECTNAAGCGTKLNEGNHIASDWITDTAATATVDGTKHKECTVCRHVLETDTIPATGDPGHSHNYGSDWKSDQTNHWKECSCGDKTEIAAHTPSVWITKTAPTATVSGTKYKICTVCHHVLETGSIPATGKFSFEDVHEDDWFFEDVMYAYENGLMLGTGATTFDPYINVTRGMMVTILYRLENEPAVSGSLPFDDVKSGSYYENAIKWAAENNIVNGYGNRKFGPDDNLTREQMVVILWRYAKYSGYDVSIGEDTDIQSYDDANSVSEYAVAAMRWACGDGIINGTSSATISPQGYAIRAQIAAILHRFCEKSGK